ncbi:MAG: hypothetical protein PHH14_01715 [Candidatus Margulisbacteria bacterium]|nr:hypothetical protein [Candidatus Margulisiibacteriota bacterium]
MAKNEKVKLKGVRVFKIRNRSGYAAILKNNLTEGRSPAQALERMIKAVKRKSKN